MSVGSQLRRSIPRDMYAETEGDYQQAIQYYTALKTSFLNNLSVTLEAQERETLDQVEQRFLTNLNASYTGTEKDEEEKDIGEVTWNSFLEVVDKLVTNYETTYGDVSKETGDLLSEYQSKYLNAYNTYNKQSKQIMKKEQTQLANSLRRYITNSAQLEFMDVLNSMTDSGQVPGDLKGAEKYIVSLAKRKYFAKQTEALAKGTFDMGAGRNTSIFYRITESNAKAGYRNAILGSLVQEKRAASAMKEYLGERVMEAGALRRVSQYERQGKTITSSAQIGSDLLFFVEEIKENEVQQIKSILGSGEIVLGKDWDSQRLQEENEEKELLKSGLQQDLSAIRNNIKSIFGANVKKWALNKMSERRINLFIGFSLGYKNIGFKYSDTNRKNAYVNNLLAGARSAIHVLGIRNVFMAQGNNISFMDDFIKSFREQQLFIQAETIGYSYNDYFKAVGTSSSIELNFNKWLQSSNVINGVHMKH